jgi:hypothetical protein
MRKNWSILARALAASLLGGLLSFVAVERAAAQVCIQLYDPVCARTKPVGVAKTFGNSCFAKAAGARVFAEHTTCEGLICPLSFLPVCGVKSGVVQQYGSRCAADRAGALFLADGYCPQVCTKEFLPVCAVNEKGARRVFGNQCAAVAAGFHVLHAGYCHRGTGCPKILKPVCAIDPLNRQPTTYGNLCVSEKANATFVRDGTCN